MYRSTVSQETAVGHKLTDIRSSEPIKLTDTRSHSKHIKAPKFKQTRKPSEMPCSADTDSQVTFRRLSAVDRCIASLRSAVFGQCAAYRFDALCFFGLRCGIAVLLFLFCMRLFLFAALCVLCCDCWLCFSLCQRIFNFCLRSFAPAGATSHCPSPKRAAQGLDPNAF